MSRGGTTGVTHAPVGGSGAAPAPAVAPDAAVAPRRTVRRDEVLGLTAATIAAFAVATIFLARREFWLDESFSYLVTRRSWADLAAFSVRSDGELNMALYYAALKPFADVDAAGWWLRLPSLIPVALTTPVVWLLADRVDGRRFVRVAAVAVFLSHVLVVDQAFEARAYGLLMLLTSGLTLLLVIGLSGSRAASVAYAVLLVLGIALHLLVVFLAVSHLVAVVVVSRGTLGHRLTRALRFTGPGLVAAALAFVVVFRHQGNREHDDPVGLRTIGSAIYGVTGRAGPLTILVLAAIAAGVVAIARDRREPGLGWVLVLTAAVTPLLELVASLQRPVFGARYLVHLVPVICCLVAIGLAWVFHERRWRVASLAVLVVLGLAGQAWLYRAPDLETPDSASAFILERAGPGDVIAFNSPNAQMPFQHHLDDVGVTGPLQVDLVTDPAVPTEMVAREPLAAAVAALDPGASAWILEDRADARRSAQMDQELGAGALTLAERVAFGEIVVERWQRGSP